MRELKRQLINWCSDNSLTVLCCCFALFWVIVAVIMISLYASFLQYKGAPEQYGDNGQ